MPHNFLTVIVQGWRYKCVLTILVQVLNHILDHITDSGSALESHPGLYIESNPGSEQNHLWDQIQDQDVTQSGSEETRAPLCPERPLHLDFGSCRVVSGCW